MSFTQNQKRKRRARRAASLRAFRGIDRGVMLAPAMNWSASPTAMEVACAHRARRDDRAVVVIHGTATSNGAYRVRDFEPGVVGVRVNRDGTVTLPATDPLAPPSR